MKNILILYLESPILLEKKNKIIFTLFQKYNKIDIFK